MQGFGIAVIILAIVRCAYPQIAENIHNKKDKTSSAVSSADSSEVARLQTPDSAQTFVYDKNNPFFNADGTEARRKIIGVYKYYLSFPDENDVQLIAAKKNGVRPGTNMAEAERRKSELVYIGSNPYFFIDNLHNSIPYLVPNASVLLQDIGRNYFDSLRVKGVPLHKIIITSIMRTKEDVVKLAEHNRNAKTNSAHLYGTTFDISQNRFKTVEDPNGPKRRVVTNDTLKWVLSEVLNDMRKHNRCLVKYEVHQGCFHVTVK